MKKLGEFGVDTGGPNHCTDMVAKTANDARASMGYNMTNDKAKIGKDAKWHYIYKLTRTAPGNGPLYYIGSRSSSARPHVDDYMGSSKAVIAE